VTRLTTLGVSMYLEKNLQDTLRLQGVISANEVVLCEGDLYVAVNVLDNSRRIVQLDRTLLESKNQKQLLKG
jgi:hypothetical protein